MPFSARFMAGLVIAGISFVLVGVALDFTTEFGSTYPITANMLAGVLGLPITGIVAALVVDYIVKSQRRREWGRVYDHIRKDVLPWIKNLLDKIELCHPGRESEIGETGNAVVARLDQLRTRVGAGAVAGSDLPAELRESIDKVVDLLEEFSTKPVTEAYYYLASSFPDLDSLDAPRVKLEILRLRQSMLEFEATGVDDDRIAIKALADLRANDRSWDGKMVRRPNGGTMQLTTQRLKAFVESSAKASRSASMLEERVWELWFAVADAVED